MTNMLHRAGSTPINVPPMAPFFIVPSAELEIVRALEQ